MDVNFGETPEKLIGEYLNVYEGVISEILYTTNFGENQI